MKNIKFQSPHHQTNSFSKYQNNKELYLDSSYISKYLGQQKQIVSPSKFMSTLYTSRFDTSIIKSPQTERDQGIGQYKQLTKNYFQKKYLMMTTGNEQQIKAWRKYLINSLKKKIEDFFNLKKQFVITSKRTLKSKFGSLSNSFQQNMIFNDEINGIHQLVKQRVPGVDLIQEQENLIKKNYHFLKNNQDMDYDTKLQKMIQQYEKIIDRIQNEAFKQKIPEYIEIKMEDYNDCYDVKNLKENPYFSQKLYSSCQSLQFTKQPLVKNQNSKSIFENLNYQIEDEIITTSQVISPRISRFQEQDLNQQKCSNFELKLVENEIDFDDLQKQKEKQKQKNLVDPSKQKDKNKPNNKHRVHQKKNRSDFNQENTNNIQLNNIEFVDYMLSLDDVYSCDLNPFKPTQNNEMKDQVIQFLDEFEFMDGDEEQVYISFTNWNDNQLLKQ